MLSRKHSVGPGGGVSPSVHLGILESPGEACQVPRLPHTSPHSRRPSRFELVYFGINSAGGWKRRISIDRRSWVARRTKPNSASRVHSGTATRPAFPACEGTEYKYPVDHASLGREHSTRKFIIGPASNVVIDHSGHKPRLKAADGKRGRSSHMTSMPSSLRFNCTTNRHFGNAKVMVCGPYCAARRSCRLPPATPQGRLPGGFVPRG